MSRSDSNEDDIRRAATAALELRFSPLQVARMELLMEKSQAGTLSVEERREMESYNKAGHFLARLKSNARKLLGDNET